VPKLVEQVITQPVEGVVPPPGGEIITPPPPVEDVWIPVPEPIMTVEPIPEPPVTFIEPDFPLYPFHSPTSALLLT